MNGAINIALSGLNAASTRVNAAARNIANAFTAGSVEEGGQAPYTPVKVTAQTDSTGGVAASFVPKDPAFIPAYDPDSPFANEDGIIGAPNVSLEEEIINLKIAEISYKANLKTIQAASHLEDELLKIVDKKA